MQVHTEATLRGGLHGEEEGAGRTVQAEAAAEPRGGLREVA